MTAGQQGCSNVLGTASHALWSVFYQRVMCIQLLGILILVT